MEPINVDQTQADLLQWLDRQARRNAKGARLFLRVGELPEDLEALDTYQMQASTAAEIWTDMQANARGTPNPLVRFVVKVYADGSQDAQASRSFSIVRAGPVAALVEPRHTPDRYEGNSDAMIRLLLEQVHESHKVITNALPSILGVQAQMMSALAQPIATMAETQDQAIRELREARALAQDHERKLLDDASRNKRLDQVYELGLQLAPVIMANIANGGKD
jgi:hypothetical protein